MVQQLQPVCSRIQISFTDLSGTNGMIRAASFLLLHFSDYGGFSFVFRGKITSSQPL